MLKASLIGNIGNDPDMRYSANGSPLLRFNVASNYRTRTPEGEYQDTTEWVSVVVFGKRVESLSEHLRKGMRVYVGGRLEARPWTDQQGQVRAGLEILADDVEFVPARRLDEGHLARASVADERRDRTRERVPVGARHSGVTGDNSDLPF